MPNVHDDDTETLWFADEGDDPDEDFQRGKEQSLRDHEQET
jgi:hypothetical protein